MITQPLQQCGTCRKTKPTSHSIRAENRYLRPCFACLVEQARRRADELIQKINWREKVCRKCKQQKPLPEFGWADEHNTNDRCKACAADIAEWRKTTKPRDYYHTPEYKRLQWKRMCERQGRPYYPGRGNNPNTRIALVANAYSSHSYALPSDFAESTWRAIEEQNARDAWRYFLRERASEEWLVQRSFVMKTRKLQHWRANTRHRRPHKRMALFLQELEIIKTLGAKL